MQPFATPRILASSLFVLLCLLTARSGIADTIDPAELTERLRQTALDVDSAVQVDHLVLDTGVARLTLEDGVVIPATGVDGVPVEMVFLGRGIVRMKAPNEVEESQLELFTGSPALGESFTEAVFVIAKDAASGPLFDRETAAVPDETAERAMDLFSTWRDSPERRLLDVETGIFLDALGDPVYEDYFAAFFSGETLGTFLLLVEPDVDEQVTLGQFVPFDLTDKERRRTRKELHSAQRRGRNLDLRLEDLGTWDTWVSTHLRRPDGTTFSGLPAFEPRNYTLDVEVDPGELTLAGRTKIDLEATTGLRRVLSLTLPRDLEVSAVRDGQGRNLFFLRSATEVHAVLPEAPSQGTTLAVEIEYAGKFLYKGDDRNWTLSDTTFWHPHAGLFARATFDVTLRWPKKLDLVAAGDLVEEGQDREWRWQRRTLNTPTWAFGFEVGRFKTHTARGGLEDHVEIELAFDPGMESRSSKEFEEIAATIGDTLEYFETVLGPYPLHHVTVVTVPRSYSQSMLGFITLSNSMMIDWQDSPITNLDLWFGFEDRRTIIAHEVAHQWWGHLIGTRSYRDVWFSEAMANYAALLWGKYRLPADEVPRVGPIYGWQQALTAPLEDGRPVESLGPVVLGPRLSSSRGSGYIPIVYQKGALVLNMLSRGLGEDVFLRMNQQLFRRLGGKDLSTQDLLSAYQAMSQVDLQGFGRQFIYGTGLPDVYYEYRVTELRNGLYQVRIEAIQETPWRFAYRVFERKDGRWDIARSRLDQIEVEQSQVVVPIHLVLSSETNRKGVQTVEYVPGRIHLTGRHTTVDFETPHNPTRVVLDPGQEVFGRFFSRERQPKRVLLYQAIDQFGAGDAEGASRLLHRVLETDTPTEDLERDRRRWIESQDDFLDARAHLFLARIHLDENRLDDADRELTQARKAASGRDRWWVDSSLRVVEARLDLLQGRYDDAFKKLRRGVLKRGDVDSTEAYVLLAIAAHRTQHPDVLNEALEAARDKGADVSLVESYSAGR